MVFTYLEPVHNLAFEAKIDQPGARKTNSFARPTEQVSQKVVSFSQPRVAVLDRNGDYEQALLQSMKKAQDILSLGQAAELLGCHPNTLRQWDNKGLLSALRFGDRRVRKYRKTDIERLLSTGESTRSLDYAKSQPVTASLPTEFGNFSITVWPQGKGAETVVLATPQIQPTLPVLVRIHSECLTGDVFHSLRCDCGAQKEQSLRQIAASGNGLFILLRQEGRGIGLYEKIKAYKLQEKGYDTFEANVMLGHAPDARDYGFVKTVLRFFHVERVRLLTNNPSKISAMAALGIDVQERVPLIVQPKLQNRQYIETKQKKFKHFFGEESNYFFEFSYAENPSQIEDIGSWIKGKIKDPFLRICVGMHANRQQLDDDLACRNIADMFAIAKTFPAFVPVLHYSFADSKHPLEDIDVLTTKLPFVEYLQLNDVQDHYTQVVQKAVQHFLVDVPLSDATRHYLEDKKFVELIKNYKAFVCLDNSHGRGQTDTFESYQWNIQLLMQKGINDIAVYGGFGPGMLDIYKRLRQYFMLNLSIDAETHVSTRGHLDVGKVKQYLSELLELKP